MAMTHLHRRPPRPDSLPVIASFWFGSDLSWLEALCIQSYLDNGHRFVLFTPHELLGVPPGTELRDASDILWPAPFDLSDNDRHRVAVFSDLFRLRMIQETGFTWVDLDAYCVRPFDFGSEYLFGHSAQNQILTGVIGLPQGSEALSAMLEFLTSENPTQPWRGPRLHRRNRQRVSQGERWGIEALEWGCSGPKAFTHFLKQSGEVQHAHPSATFYPLGPDELWKLHSAQISPETIEQKDVYSVHIYGHQKKLMAKTMSGLPRLGSYLWHLCERHNIDPNHQRIPTLKWMNKVYSK